MHEIQNDAYALAWLLGVALVVGAGLTYFSHMVAKWVLLIEDHKRAARLAVGDKPLAGVRDVAVCAHDEVT
jgi:hypothetical protein